MKLVVFGEAGSGKDYITDILSKRYGFKRYAFADGVRELAEEYFPDRYDINKKDRSLLQDIGTKMREVDMEIWIKRLLKKIHDEEDGEGLLELASVSVTDCRLPNEYKALKEEGFIFVRVIASPETRLERMHKRGDVFKEEDMQHITESHYGEFECDYTINNDVGYDSERQLIKQINTIVEDIVLR